MRRSPHLASLIRRLHVGLEQSVLSRLSMLHIPNLQELSLRGNPQRRFASRPAAIEAAANLLSLPTIRHVSLTYLCFQNMWDLNRLFEKYTSELHSLSLDTVSALFHSGVPASPRRIRPKSLCIRDPVSASQSASAWRSSKRFEWLFRPLCPFDLTGLHDIDYDGAGMFYTGSELLVSSRSTLRMTSLGESHSESPRIVLGDLPALTHLTINTIPAYMHTKLASVAAAFRSDSVLRVVVNVRLRSMELNMTPELFEGSTPWDDIERNARATLANWDIIDELNIARLSRVSSSPDPCTALPVNTGYIKLTLGGNDYGYIRKTLDGQNSFTKTATAVLDSTALFVTLPLSPFGGPFDITATPGPVTAYPLLGAVGGSGGYNFQPNNVGYAYLAATGHTPANAPPSTTAGTSIQSLGYNGPSKSQMWSDT
ncbi:hypothetical protein DFH06DRAFT_1486486 [Mycena polygramma]|nr:hypothetical protein DFH06DRAFT_1486486 [Mycena polygramma]